MKNITILSNGHGTVSRGAEKYTQNLYDLLKKDYNMTIESAKTQGSPTRNQLRVPWRNGRAYLEAYFFGKSVYRKHYILGKPDLIINNAGFVGSYWCNKIRRKIGTPFITLERGGGHEERLNEFFKPDLISYLTEYSYNKSKYPKKVHLPIGIDTQVTKRAMPKELKKQERPIIFSPSALVKFKRIPLTIKALEGIKGTLVQTSSGNEKFIEKSKILDNFLYLGKVDETTLEAIFQNSDLVVSSSKRESFGIIYLEAMKYNVPIVTQDDEIRREIIGDAGMFCDCRNYLDYGNTILKALTAGWGDIPRRQALKYDWEKLKPGYIEVIEGLT